jgi:hypothetical protein
MTQINAMAVDATAVNAVGDAFEPAIESAMGDQERSDASSALGQSNAGNGGSGGSGGGGGCDH